MRLPLDHDALLRLAKDLPTVWNASTTDMRLKQRVVRILVEEIVADVDESVNQVVLILRWAGGRHSKLRIAKNKTGHHRRVTDPEVIEIIRQMAGQYNNEEIAATLNRLKLRTGPATAGKRIVFNGHVAITDSPRIIRLTRILRC